MQKLHISKRWLANILIVLIVIGYVCAGMLNGGARRYYNDVATSLGSGWLAADGTSYRLRDLPDGEITLTHSVAEIPLESKRLCLKSIDTFFTVLADGVEIYSYHPEEPAIFGRSYGMYMHMIPIPVGTQEITLELIPIFADTQPALRNVLIADPGMYMGDVFKQGMPGFCACFLMTVLGLVMIFISAFTAKQGQQIEFFTLGIFSVLVAVWSVNDTLILQLLTQNPALIRMINYVSLIFLPYLPVSFIAGAVSNKHSPLLPCLFVIVCLNLTANLLLCSFGIADYYQLVRITQGTIVIAILMALYLVVTAAEKHLIERKFFLTLITGTTVLSLGVVADLLIYRLSENTQQVSSQYTRLGTILFLVFIGLYLIREYNSVQLENSRTELMAKLAYTDGLTGLQNRLAFNEKESELMAQTDTSCMLVQLDINDLKKVNDCYGHAEGDRHIVSAARIIQDSFPGNCYRTGGDEFIAIVSGNEDAAWQAVERMEQRTRTYNKEEDPPVPLDIAFGMALFRIGENTMESAMQLADERMYECKKHKKGIQ